MNSKNSGTSEPHVLLFNLTSELDLKSGLKSVALSNLSIYYTWKKVKDPYNNNKCKISAPTWSDTFDLSHGSIKYLIYKTILYIFLKNMVKVLMIHHLEYT